MGNLTPLQQDERDAMCGDRAAVLRVVSALRGYREAVRSVLSTRYRDGFIDGVAAAALSSSAEEIEGVDPEQPR